MSGVSLAGSPPAEPDQTTTMMLSSWFSRPAVLSHYLTSSSLPLLRPTFLRFPIPWPQKYWFTAYISRQSTISLLRNPWNHNRPLLPPAAYVLGGFARDDDHAVRLVTPDHLFLLSLQILTEIIISGFSVHVSPPVGAPVPLLYTARRRILVIQDWIQDVWLTKTLPPNAQFKDVSCVVLVRKVFVSCQIGVYMSYNLFVFLILRFLPKPFEM